MGNNASEIFGQLLNCFLENDLPWMKSVAFQINSASWTFEDLQSSCFFDFCCSVESTARIPSSIEVPVEIIFGKVKVDPNAIIGRISRYPVVVSTKHMTFIISDPSAFAARLHFRNGIIFELEVYSIDGNTLDFSGIESKDRIYILDSEILSFLE